MDGWMDGWKEGWTEERMGGWMEIDKILFSINKTRVKTMQSFYINLKMKNMASY